MSTQSTDIRLAVLPTQSSSSIAESGLDEIASDLAKLVTGEVRLKLYKGSVGVVGRDSPYSLYDQDLVTFEEGAVAYDHHDAGGFIKLNALRLRTLAKRKKKVAKA